ncbi:MAG: alpha/beta hydrolase [Burkholderiaceae bacterium]
MFTQPSVPGVTHSNIKANGIDMHVARAGNGLPLVLLHGWPEFWYAWHKLVPLLSDKFELIMPDLRGFGATEKPHKHPSDQDNAAVMAEDIYALAGALGLKQFGLVSHDVGSQVAQMFARRHAGRLTGLFFFNCVHAGIGKRWFEPGHLSEIWYQSFHQKPWAAELIASSREAARIYFGHQMAHWAHDPKTFDADLDIWLDNFLAPGNMQGGFNWYISANAARIAVMKGEAPLLPPITTPSYVFWGRHDPVIKAQWADNIGDSFLDVTVEIAEDAGHFVHYEMPDHAAQKIAAFFSRLL